MHIKQKHPHLRVILSIGGPQSSNVFPTVAASAVCRDNFARSARGLVEASGLDGVDSEFEKKKRRSLSVSGSSWKEANQSGPFFHLFRLSRVAISYRFSPRRQLSRSPRRRPPLLAGSTLHRHRRAAPLAQRAKLHRPTTHRRLLGPPQPHGLRPLRLARRPPCPTVCILQQGRRRAGFIGCWRRGVRDGAGVSRAQDTAGHSGIWAEGEREQCRCSD